MPNIRFLSVTFLSYIIKKEMGSFLTSIANFVLPAGKKGTNTVMNLKLLINIYRDMVLLNRVTERLMTL